MLLEAAGDSGLFVRQVRRRLGNHPEVPGWTGGEPSRLSRQSITQMMIVQRGKPTSNVTTPTIGIVATIANSSEIPPTQRGNTPWRTEASPTAK